MSWYSTLKTLVRVIVIVLLAFVVLWANSQLPSPFQLDAANVFGAVVLLAVLYYLVDLVISILFQRTLPPK